MPAAKITSTRKRNRKRKRRAAFSSSSSESSDASSSEAEDQHPAPKTSGVAISSAESSPSPSSSDSSSSNSDSESDSGTDEESPAIVRPAPTQKHSPQAEPRALTPTRQNFRAARASPSPSPPPATLPSFLPPNGEDPTKTQEMRDKFRKFWMASVAEGFKDDLEQIRKEPNLTTTKLAMLIDSLASGAEVFTSETKRMGTNGVDEVEVILG